MVSLLMIPRPCSTLLLTPCGTRVSCAATIVTLYFEEHCRLYRMAETILIENKVHKNNCLHSAQAGDRTFLLLQFHACCCFWCRISFSSSYSSSSSSSFLFLHRGNREYSHSIRHKHTHTRWSGAQENYSWRTTTKETCLQINVDSN